MNQLNSVILEGDIVEDAVVQDGAFGPTTEFNIAVKRFYKGTEGNPMEEVSIFPIVAKGLMAEKLAEKWGEKGQGIRVVGRLKQVKSLGKVDTANEPVSKIVIIAEHIEFKPRPTKA